MSRSVAWVPKVIAATDLMLTLFLARALAIRPSSPGRWVRGMEKSLMAAPFYRMGFTGAKNEPGPILKGPFAVLAARRRGASRLQFGPWQTAPQASRGLTERG